jgi:hypothetical protein
MKAFFLPAYVIYNFKAAQLSMELISQNYNTSHMLNRNSHKSDCAHAPKIGTSRMFITGSHEIDYAHIPKIDKSPYKTTVKINQTGLYLFESLLCTLFGIFNTENQLKEYAHSKDQ